MTFRDFEYVDSECFLVHVSFFSFEPPSGFYACSVVWVAIVDHRGQNSSSVYMDESSSSCRVESYAAYNKQDLRSTTTSHYYG
jgi:hypothetical protein